MPSSNYPGPSSLTPANASHRAEVQRGHVATDLRNPGDATTKKKRKRMKASMEDSSDVLLTPWVDSLPMTEYESKEQRLHDEIIAYVSWILPTPQEARARQQVFQLLERAIKSRFHDADVRMFGSVAHNLCLPDGDIDIVICSRRFPDARIPLFQLSPIIKQSGFAQNVQINRFAKVPVMILQTTEEFGSFNIDISINHDDGTNAIEPINKFLTDMPALRPLIMVVKGFLTQRGLNSAATSGLSSYAVICMVISFLQINPNQRPADFFGNPLESESLGTLLMDFLLYYGSTFPYTMSYISVTSSKILPKDTADWINNNPANRLAVQCLVRPDNDIAKSAGRIETIREAFRETWNILTKIPLKSNNLQVVVRFRQTVLGRREHIRNIVDSGSLARDARLVPLHRQQTSQGVSRNKYPNNHFQGSSERNFTNKRRKYDEH